MNRFLQISACLLLFAQAVQAQPGISMNGGPIEITAQDSMEWFRDENRFVARGDAFARQGDMSLSAETLQALYENGSEQDFALTRITAQSNVVLTSGENSIFGQNATYDLKTGVAVITGRDLKMIGPRGTLSADERFEYRATEREVLAIGNAEVIREDTILKSDQLLATLGQNAAGDMIIDRVNATGGVEIITPAETLTGDEGVYDEGTNTAEVTGNVKLRRGESILEGERAVIDLSTNVSKLFGGATTNERVKGVFYPEQTP